MTGDSQNPGASLHVEMAAKRFIEAQEATLDLVEFASSHANRLDSREKLAISIAERANLEIESGAALDLFSAAEVVERTVDEEVRKATATETNRTLASNDETSTGSNFDPEAFKEALHPFFHYFKGRRGAFINYFSTFLRVKSRPQRAPTLYASLLTRAVGDLEVLIGSLVNAFYMARPEALYESGAQYQWQDIARFNTLDEFKLHCIEKQVENLVRGSYEDWISWFKKRLSLESSGQHVGAVISAVREPIQRRHIIVHNGGRVSHQYLTNTVGMRPDMHVDSLVTVDEKYIRSALDAIACVALLLIDVVARRLRLNDSKNELLADVLMQNWSFELLLDGRYSVVADAYRAISPKFDGSGIWYISKVNSWIAWKKLSGVQSILAEVDEWDTSALEPRFKLAKLALRGEDEEAWNMALRLVESGDLNEEALTSWPLLDEARIAVATDNSDGDEGL